ncbi:MAG: glucan biosynthesis protein D [Hyphomicrobiales bacterium]|nr:MAG: glucan biosynthesis protein D [Hyphomicrobiales bacterium]
MDRRRFLNGSVSLLVLAGAGVALPVFADEAAPPAGSEFSFDKLSQQMQSAAATEWAGGEPKLPDLLKDFSYDQYRAIRYRPDRSLWRGSESAYEAQAFHPGWLFKRPVQLFEVVDGRANPVVYTAADFEYRAPLDPAQFAGFELPGVAGFRLHYPLNRPDYRDELISFLGASYFRSLGRNSIYGLSARGLAINTASDTREEFPAFTSFYLERPAAGATAMRLWATLEGPSVTGAYAFTIQPGSSTVVDVTARLFFRDGVERLGVAPLTSMFLFGENERAGFDDYRPEVHDSDGLAIVNGDGEQVFRPLRNPPSLRVSFFSVANPRGFGLEQRDRDFNNYQDLEAQYDRRPSLWIEPQGTWGQGRVVLAEIPSKSEANDNIVAFWQPEAAPAAGEAREYSYRMYWGDQPHGNADLARVVATRSGHATTPVLRKDPAVRKFVIDFADGMLASLPPESRLTPEVECSNGSIVDSVLQPLKREGRWRLVLDVKRDGTNPVELRSFLRFNDQRLSETWLYQWSVE